MPGDTTLAMLIGDTGLVKVKKRLKGKMLLFSGIVNKIKPFFTLALLSEGAFKHNKSSSLDEYFQKIAKKNKLGVIGIETIEEQMAAVDKIPLTTQAQMLLDEVEHPNNEADTSAIEMLKTYLHQDIETLQGYLTEESTPEEMNKYILQERNVVMAKLIHKIIQMQPTFIGIGAAHLGGTNGIINILKIKGYKLRAVNAPFKK